MATPSETAAFLVAKNGMDEEAAHRLIVQHPETVERLERQTDQFLTERAEQAERDRAEAFLRTPEGRRVLAQRLRQEEAARRELVEDAKRLLLHEGFDRESLGEMSADELLMESGLIAKPVELMSDAEKDRHMVESGELERADREFIVRHWDDMAEEDRRAAAAEHGLPIAELANEAATIAAQRQAELYRAAERPVPEDVARVAAGQSSGDADGEGGESA